MLDTLRRVETPEGVELSLRVAGPVARARAWLIDVVVKFGALWCAAIVAAILGETGQGLILIFIFLLTWLYPVVFEVLLDGATPGKRMTGLRVVHDDGMPVGWSASMIRSVVGYVDMLPLVYGLGLVVTLLHPDFKRLGDMAAGTVVVHVEKPRRATTPAPVAPVAPVQSLLAAEQYALIEFATRAELLTPERQSELAKIAGRLTFSDSDPVEQIVAQARWVAGDR